MPAGTASLSTNQKRVSGAPFGAGAANNGVSVDPVSGKIVLGNNTGSTSAQLLSRRDIELNGFSLNVVNNAAQRFLMLDDATKLYAVGDIDVTTNGTAIFVDNSAGSSINMFAKVGGSPLSPVFEANNNGYNFGDLSISRNGSAILIADSATNILLRAASRITFQDILGNVFLRVDQSNNTYELGDLSNASTTTKLSMLDVTQDISFKTKINGVNNSLALSLSGLTGLYRIGDISNSKFGTKLILDDLSKTVTLTNPTAVSFGINTLVPTHTLTLASTSNGIAQYNTADQIVNLERALFSWSGNIYRLDMQNAGTGTARSLFLNTANGNIFIASTSSLGTVKLGATMGAGSCGIMLNGTANGSSGVTFASASSPTINQSGTAAYTALIVSPFQQATGSGVKNLLDLGTNSAADLTGTHTSLLRVDNTGHIFESATNTATGTTGNQTINKPSGTVNIAAAGTTVTVTNSLVTTASIILVVIRTADATAKTAVAVPAAGSFVATLNAAATAEVSIGFFVLN